MLEVQLKNIDKNLIGNIIIIVSIILLVLFIVLFISSTYEPMDNQIVEWNGIKYEIPYDSEYEITNDSLKITSEYEVHTVEFAKTNDTAKVNKHLANYWSWSELKINSTHMLLECDNNYGIIVPTDGYQIQDTIKINDNVEVIEVHGNMRFATDLIYNKEG